MIKLSVIIVNYNVKYFLQQVLQSALKAAEKVSTEIIVVDNNSVDGSVEMLQQRFPQITLVHNRENTGFAKANNQGIRIANGEYILLLNPDTLVEEDTFEKTVAFMDAHPDAGGLGVKMIDGKGHFLRESKRGFPSPTVAFYKMFGLSSLFPKSRIFGKYHMGYLDEDEVNEVDVLAGAFMLLRREVLDKAGLLDETFFMYGEDIDLSYRIIQAGYKNYYFPETRIIHYKGESTKKGSLNYVRMFYSAMEIFAGKHFSGRQARLFTLLINVAIYFRAVLALVNRIFQKVYLPILDAVVIYGGMYLIKNFWEDNIKWLEGIKYPPEYLLINVPLYILIWLSSLYFSGAYDNNTNYSKIIRGVFAGTILIAAVYGFLEEDLRFSRGMILSGAIWTGISVTSIRLMQHFIRFGNIHLGEKEDKKIVIVGGMAESIRVRELLNSYNVRSNLIGFVNSSKEEFQGDNLLGDVDHLMEIVDVFKIDEVIFCGRDILSQQIIQWMTKLGGDIDYKIVPREGLSIIGSNSKNSAGDLYTIEIHLKIAEADSKRNKRLLDLIVSAWLFITLPVNILIVQKPLGLLKNLVQVLCGKKTWVGYESKGRDLSSLPSIRQSILTPIDALSYNQMTPKTIERLNMLYAKDYSTSNDISIIYKAYRKLGRN